MYTPHMTSVLCCDQRYTQLFWVEEEGVDLNGHFFCQLANYAARATAHVCIFLLMPVCS